MGREEERKRERRGGWGVVRERQTEKRDREEIENMKIERTAGVRVCQGESVRERDGEGGGLSERETHKEASLRRDREHEDRENSRS